MPSVESLSATEPAPTLSRRHAAGAESARGLLFTVLGEFVLPTTGSAWTAAFIEVLGRLGVEERATRQALMRTAADGWLKSHRQGRRTLWTLSAAAERLLGSGAERIYGFQGTQPDWDGRWVVVLARAPESDRPARHLLRTRLTWAGFGSPAPGVWISTHPDRATEAERVLGEVGLLDDAHVFVGPHTGGGELTAMVGQAWDLAAISAQYGDFLAEFGGRSTGDSLTRLVQLVHAWRRFPAMDPALPAELLPTGWSGARAAALFRRQHARLTAEARTRWQQLAN
ncbi:MAG TPA: PaaX family transcriptional regulator C-terminal domain-containing protein [Pseudonocardiaceae bacterium]|jgi:phenylacetic acid degradation operon negative regulatory protein|nr:PaaX family transcriptional regulator C-terminal domain-containing protein [Pseudonocardiaceae bacterium]